MIIAYLDFEFFNSKEHNVTPVCVTIDVWAKGKREFIEDFWLYEHEEGVREFAAVMADLHKRDAILCSYAFTAEARALLALGIEPTSFRAIDLYLEYRQLANSNNEVEYGKHLIGGKVKFIKPPPRYGEEREPDANYHQMEFNLASCTYKFLGVQRDTDHKELMRHRIIRGGPYTQEEGEAIVKYCHEDVAHLRELHLAMWKAWKDYIVEREEDYNSNKLMEEQFVRAEYAARTARMEQLGYPIDVEAARRLSLSVPAILRELQRDINTTLKGVVDFKVFEWDKGKQDFKRNVKLITDYFEEKYGMAWPERTEGGTVSISADALQKMTSSRHAYKPTLVDQLLRFARFQQSINGFRPAREATQKTIWDYVGSDGRVRPYFGIYGAQSARSQPSATSFIFLKSAVFRGLVQPGPGRYMLASDWGQQEFLVAALLSGDPEMIAAYKSGDVYLYFAKKIGAVPQSATKQSHSQMRDRMKSSILGIQFLMGSKSLAAKITDDTGTPTSEEQAKDIIDQFFSTFHVFRDWQQELIQNYRQAQRKGNGMTIRLGDGWRLLGDNPNHRSTANCPIQGFGSVAMRLAVARCQQIGIDVNMTLHDCLYAEAEYGDWATIDAFVEAMAWGFEEAVKLTFGGKLPAHYTPCRQDPQAWGPDFTGEEILTPAGRKIPVQSRYLDKRAKDEIKKWAPILWPEDDEEDLDL
jgi:DNA polymerase I-like protein with 3'-5' exonuclease and polymerase domains